MAYCWFRGKRYHFLWLRIFRTYCLKITTEKTPLEFVGSRCVDGLPHRCHLVSGTESVSGAVVCMKQAGSQERLGILLFLP